MAGTFGTYWQGNILKDRLGQATATQQTLFLALGTQTLWTAAGTAPSWECSNDGGYARYPIGTNSMFEAVTNATLAPSSGAIATNTATLTISAGTTSDWGSVCIIALMNTTTVGTGDILAWCTAAATRVVAKGDQVLIAAGSLSIQVGP